jgi:type IX secretion system PorP/SprF family membrane protein
MKNILVLVALLTVCIAAEAQSHHFSQFYSTPMLVNPATTGATRGPYRLAANYRSQWSKESSPYTTFTASADAHVLSNALIEGNTLGLGLTFLNDKTLDGVVQTNSFALSAGYHIALDAEDIQSIGVGFQGTYNERRVDFTRLSFENQYGNNGYDPTLPIGELLQSGKKQYMDLNAGALYSFTLEDRSLFAGAAMYNILKKEDNYMTEQFKAPSLFSVMAGGDIDVGYNHSFYFSGNYRRQGNAEELTLGAAYGMFIDPEGYSAFRVGLWHRFKDAIIPYVGLAYSGLQLGASFDITTSQAKTTSQIRNTFEISLVYVAEDRSELMRLIPWY